MGPAPFRDEVDKALVDRADETISRVGCWPFVRAGGDVEAIQKRAIERTDDLGQQTSHNLVEGFSGHDVGTEQHRAPRALPSSELPSLGFESFWGEPALGLTLCDVPLPLGLHAPPASLRKRGVSREVALDPVLADLHQRGHVSRPVLETGF